MQNWTELYKELAQILKTNIPALQWIDLWHNQVNFLSEEHPFPAPALFLAFRTMTATDMGNKVQSLTLQIDTYLFYETFADTYHDSWNQGSAMAFLDTLSNVYATLHGSDGTNYSSMRRTGFSPVDTGGAGNTYLQTFECTLIDYAAMTEYEEQQINDLDVHPFVVTI